MESHIQKTLKANILNNIPVAIAFQDLDQKIQWANKSYLKAVGITFEELTGKKCFSILGHSRPCLNCPVTKTIETGDMAEAELTIENQEEWRHPKLGWKIKITPIKDADGTIIGVAETFLDLTEGITQYSRQEKIMPALLRLFEYATTHTTHELLKEFLDEAEQITESRIGFYHFIEEDQETISLQMWSSNTQKVCSVADAGTHYPINEAGVWVDCVREKIPVTHNDYESLPYKKGLPKGHVTIIRDLVVPVLRGGKLVAILGVGNKETFYDKYDTLIVAQLAELAWETVFRKRSEEEYKKLQKQFVQAQKMETMGTLAGGIAHDFNNILFPILGHTEMLLEEIPEDSSFRDSLNEIYTSSLRAKELVKQILTFSRQDTSELKLMKLQPVINEALKLIRSTIPTTIEITQDLRPDCGIIKADPTQIHQILMNLTTNAYHAMEETGGKLNVSLKEIELGEQDVLSLGLKPDIYACLRVSDTGVGMDKYLIQKIFDPFFTTKELGKGTGMGLSVVHGIVKNAGGSIHVYSETNKGTEFQVYFPVERSSFKEEKKQVKEKIQGGTEQILLVDDEYVIIKMEKQMLERMGYKVVSRTNSIEALETFRANPYKFDLVITDMAMPNMPGDKLAAELTQIRPDIPILLCTGFSETISEDKAMALGIKGFLMKPVVMKNLSKKIRDVLGKARGGP